MSIYKDVGVHDDVFRTEMNYQVDEVGKNPEEVAKEFLLTNNLIEK